MSAGPTGAAPVVVAVDGPAGSGKSSVSRAAARALDFAFLDTGAVYRAFAWYGLKAGVDLDDADAVARALDGFDFDLAIYPPDDRRVTVGGDDVTAAIREPRVSGAVSAVARVPAVRQRLTAWFRSTLADAERGVVLEGRDTTTVVAPDAAVRVLLTAAPEVRAARRARELPGQAAGDVARAIAERDAKDSRVVDFLEAAEGVTTLDSTTLDFDGTVAALTDLVRQVQR